jgi:hypothetical protein
MNHQNAALTNVGSDAKSTGGRSLRGSRPGPVLLLTSDVKELYGVGKVFQKKFGKVGIVTVEDLVVMALATKAAGDSATADARLDLKLRALSRFPKAGQTFCSADGQVRVARETNTEAYESMKQAIQQFEDVVAGRGAGIGCCRRCGHPATEAVTMPAANTNLK